MPDLTTAPGSAQDDVPERPRHAQLQSVLLAALRDDGRAPHLARRLTDDQGPHLVAAAQYHGITSWVASVLVDVEHPALVPLRARASELRAERLRAQVELAHLGRLLDAAGITWIVVKGPVLAEHVYGRRGARAATDVDVLVSSGDFARAREVVLAAGGRDVWTNWALARQLHLGEHSMRTRAGTALDLHWALGVTPQERSRMRFDEHKMLARHRRVAGDLQQLPALDATDQLLHLCAHTVRSGGHRLGWALDLQQAVLHDPPGWPELVTRARETSTGLVAAVALHRARSVLDLPLPAGTLELLAGPRGQSWRRLSALHDRINPPSRSWDRPLSARQVLPLTSRTSLASTGRLVEAVGRLAVDVVTLPDHDWRRRARRRPVAVPASEPLAQDAGTAADRAATLDWVSARGR